MDAVSRLRRGFVTGVIIVAPLAVTVLVIQFVFNWLVGKLTPIIGVVSPGQPGILIQLVSIGVLLTVITGLGLAARHSLGRYAALEFDNLVESIPVVRGIYSSVRQASNALLGHGEQFERVALVEWPREEVHTIGFVTAETPAEIAENLEAEEDRYNVFVPMAPNPMGGFLAVLPESRLVRTDLTVRDGLELVLTTGLRGEDDLPIDPE